MEIFLICQRPNSGADFSPFLTENLFLVLQLSIVSSNTLYHVD